MRRPLLILLTALAAPLPALAAPATLVPDGPTRPAWHVDLADAPASAALDARGWRDTFTAPALDVSAALVLPATVAPAEAAAAQRPTAVTYSDGYYVRAKIHKIASFATAPLFIAEYIAGQRLYDYTGGSGTRSAHGALAGSIAALFGVNTVTGVWNLVEARHDPNGRTRRWVHGLLMLAADAGFAATGALAPDDDEGGSGNRSLHRNVAITSMSLATVGYLVMLLPH
ncbi:MAG: hypothetical protein AB7O67_04745 [Vicinamibacterales bacterium]